MSAGAKWLPGTSRRSGTYLSSSVVADAMIDLIIVISFISHYTIPTISIDPWGFSCCSRMGILVWFHHHPRSCVLAGPVHVTILTGPPPG